MSTRPLRALLLASVVALTSACVTSTVYEEVFN
jgi:hypothetical protein